MTFSADEYRRRVDQGALGAAGQKTPFYELQSSALLSSRGGLDAAAAVSIADCDEESVLPL